MLNGGDFRDPQINEDGTFVEPQEAPKKVKKTLRTVRNVVVMVAFAIFVFFLIYGIISR